MTFAPMNPFPKGRDEVSHCGSGFSMPVRSPVNAVCPSNSAGVLNQISKGTSDEADTAAETMSPATAENILCFIPDVNSGQHRVISLQFYGKNP